MELKLPPSDVLCALRECSNRTFMELKHLFISSIPSEDKGSNRTFMELKQARYVVDIYPSIRSNRTFMELKLRSLHILGIERNSVLIVPLWN